MGDSASATVEPPKSGMVSEVVEFTERLKSRAQGDAKKTDPQTKAPDAAPAKTDRKEPVEGKAEEQNKAPKTIEQVSDELSQQAKANLRLGKELAEEKRAKQDLLNTVKRLEAKFDGTHVEPTAEDKVKEQSKAEWADYVRRQEEGKAELLGDGQMTEAELVKLIEDEQAPFRKIATKKPYLVHRIIKADNPVREAVDIVREETIFEEFGRTRESVLKKAKELVRADLFKEFETEIKGKASESAPSLRQARPAGESGGQGTPAPFSAAKLFRHNSV